MRETNPECRKQRCKGPFSAPNETSQYKALARRTGAWKPLAPPSERERKSLKVTRPGNQKREREKKSSFPGQGGRGKKGAAKNPPSQNRRVKHLAVRRGRRRRNNRLLRRVCVNSCCSEGEVKLLSCVGGSGGGHPRLTAHLDR